MCVKAQDEGYQKMTHRGGVNAVGFFPLCKSHSLKCHDFGSGSCNLEQKTSGGNTDWRINFFFILKRDSWWVLPPLPAAAFSSHQESAEYSEQKFRAVWSNLGWSLSTRKRCRLLVPAWPAVGNTSEHRASFLHKRYLEKPAPDPPRSVPLAPACRGELTVLPAPPFSPQCSPVCDCSTPQSSCKAPVPKWNKLCYGKRKSAFGHWFYTASTNHGLFL